MKKIYESDNIVEFIKTRKEGEIITYKELQEYTHYELSNYIELERFKKNTMTRAKNKLIDDGIVIKGIPGEGYYILKSNQIQSYTYRTYIKRPIKQLEKSKKILENTKKAKLNQYESAKHLLTLALNNELLKENNTILNSEDYKDLNK